MCSRAASTGNEVDMHSERELQSSRINKKNIRIDTFGHYCAKKRYWTLINSGRLILDPRGQIYLLLQKITPTRVATNATLPLKINKK